MPKKEEIIMPIRDDNGNIIKPNINLDSFIPCKEPLWEHSMPIDKVRQALKLLSFNSDTENERINEVAKKLPSNITKEDIEYFNRYKNIQKYLEILVKYKHQNNLTREDWKILNECLYENLEKIILDKLSKEELLKLKEKLNEYCKTSMERLKIIILEYEKKYDDLNLQDASIYYFLSSFYYQKKYIINTHQMNKEFYERMKKYDSILVASEYYAQRM